VRVVCRRPAAARVPYAGQAGARGEAVQQGAGQAPRLSHALPPPTNTASMEARPVRPPVFRLQSPAVRLPLNGTALPPKNLAPRVSASAVHAGPNARAGRLCCAGLRRRAGDRRTLPAAPLSTPPGQPARGAGSCAPSAARSRQPRDTARPPPPPRTARRATLCPSRIPEKMAAPGRSCAMMRRGGTGLYDPACSTARPVLQRIRSSPVASRVRAPPILVAAP
jgi:hypothetical protein